MSGTESNFLPTGYVLQGYEIVKKLGEGTFGVTYLARDVSLDSLVAIKEYFPINGAVRRYSDMHIVPRDEASPDSFDNGLEGFLREAKTLALFPNEPNIVKILRFFKENGTGYFVMPFIQSRELKEVIASEGTLSADYVRNMLIKLIGGLEKVHAVGYLHRDIKPANILIADATAEPILIDFGAARHAMGEDAQKDLSVILTESFAAPEQHDPSAKLSAPADIFGLAGVAYNCLVGSPPPKCAFRSGRDPYEPLAPRASNAMEQNLFAAIDWGLQLDDRKRPQTLAEWRNGIEHGVSDASQVASGARGGDGDQTIVVSRTSGRSTGSNDDATMVVNQPNGPASPDPATSQAVSGKTGVRGPAVFAGVALAALLLGGGAFVVLNNDSDGDEDVSTAEVTRNTTVVNTAWQKLDLPQDGSYEQIGFEADKPFRIRVDGNTYLIDSTTYGLPTRLGDLSAEYVEVRGLEPQTSITMLY